METSDHVFYKSTQVDLSSGQDQLHQDDSFVCLCECERFGFSVGCRLQTCKAMKAYGLHLLKTIVVLSISKLPPFSLPSVH